MKHTCYGETEKDIEMIDELFNLIINNDTAISVDFYLILKKLDFIYTKQILEVMTDDGIQVLKDIVFTLYEIYNSRFNYLLPLFRRQTLIDLYNICKDAENRTEINNFIAYYKKSVINKYTENIT